MDRWAWKRILKENRGSIAVVAAAAVIGITGIAALAVDVGALYLNRF